MGAGTARLLFRHLIPNAMGPIIVTLTLSVPSAIFAEAFLSFLGLGVQAPVASWGSMINDALSGWMYYPWRMLFPALFISLTMLAFNIFGDGLRDALDPKLKNRRWEGMEPILQVKDLNVSFRVRGGEVKAVRGMNFEVGKGRRLPSSVSPEAVKCYRPDHYAIDSVPALRNKKGEVIFQGQDLLKTNKQMEAIRGKDIGMIFQDPMTSLNPTIRIGKQITEVLIKHQGMSFSEAKTRHRNAEAGGHQNAEERFNQYPHEFSGGMRQRAMIAIALACKPTLLIADEPTTALDVTIQAQIMDVMKEMQERLGTSIILITHDLGVVAGMCDRVIVMYAGEVVETGTKWEIFKNPRTLTPKVCFVPCRVWIRRKTNRSFRLSEHRRI